MCNWNLNSEISNKKISINISKNPFELHSDEIKIDFSIKDYKEIIFEFWNNYLKPCINQTINKSKNSINFDNFDIVLISFNIALLTLFSKVASSSKLLSK